MPSFGVSDHHHPSYELCGWPRDFRSSYLGRWFNVEQEEPAESPAGSRHLNGLPNGIYCVQSPEGVYNIRLHTVTRSGNSDVLGTRVISLGFSGAYTIRGWLTVSGHLRLWRRYREELNSSWANAVRAALCLMRQQTIFTPGLVVFSRPTQEISVQAQRLMCCWCNREMSGPAYDGLWVCSGHLRDNSLLISNHTRVEAQEETASDMSDLGGDWEK